MTLRIYVGWYQQEGRIGSPRSSFPHGDTDSKVIHGSIPFENNPEKRVKRLLHHRQVKTTSKSVRKYMVFIFQSPSSQQIRRKLPLSGLPLGWERKDCNIYPALRHFRYLSKWLVIIWMLNRNRCLFGASENKHLWITSWSSKRKVTPNIKERSHKFYQQISPQKPCRSKGSGMIHSKF